MNPGDIYLGRKGSEVKIPEGARKVTLLPVEESVSERTVSKKLVEDVIRRYTNYQINYEVMVGSDHEIFESLYNLNEHLNLIVMGRLGNQDSFTVKMTWTPGTRESIAGGWLWSGVSAMLEVV